MKYDIKTFHKKMPLAVFTAFANDPPLVIKTVFKTLTLQGKNDSR